MVCRRFKFHYKRAFFYIVFSQINAKNNEFLQRQKMAAFVADDKVSFVSSKILLALLRCLFSRNHSIFSFAWKELLSAFLLQVMPEGNEALIQVLQEKKVDRMGLLETKD